MYKQPCRPWYQIANLRYANSTIHKCHFTSYGDWVCTISSAPQKELPHDLLIHNLHKKYKYLDNTQFKILPEIKTFEEGLADCGVKCENLGNFMRKNGIQGNLVYYERLTYGGNCKISVMRDLCKWYIVYYATS